MDSLLDRQMKLCQRRDLGKGPILLKEFPAFSNYFVTKITKKFTLTPPTILLFLCE
jgi:hypothetical protein